MLITPHLLKNLKKQLQKFWDCKDCENKSRKLRNLRHESGCPKNRIVHDNRFPRMCYFGHHLIASIDGYDDGEALWKCYTCCQIWFAFDGETCPYCGSINRTHGPNPIHAKKSPDFDTKCDYSKIQHLFPEKPFTPKHKRKDKK